MTTRKKIIKILQDCRVSVPDTRGKGDLYAILLDNLEELVDKEKLKVLRVIADYEGWAVGEMKMFKEELGL